jgi:phosphoenolpyruvate---glycerone phosphotransferase subunit DhaL
MLTREDVTKWLYNAGKSLEANKEVLNQLDAAIGDAEHGTNMVRGFQKVINQLSYSTETDIESIFKSAGMFIISTVGGASGQLYGSFFLKASTAASGKYELAEDELLAVLKAGLKGVVDRGKAQQGDKTMIDALVPSIETFEIMIRKGNIMAEALKQAVVAAQKGMEDTITMVARKGRASYLGERSIGHQDPGATSMYLILKALYDSISS